MDYGVDTLFSADKNHTVIRLARVELFPMPVEVKVIYINGQTEEFCIPIDLMRGNCPFDKKTKKISLPYWPWVRTTYEIKLESPLDKIKEIIVDPDENLLDINLKNNIWTSIKQNN